MAARMKWVLLILMLMTIYSGVAAQQPSPDEKQLYNLLMAYRKANGLPLIPLSHSLTIVAQTHAADLEENYTRNDRCNMHSWSNKGKWTPVCYTADHAQSKLMWAKPRELTSYTGNGYEIAFAEDEDFLANAPNAIDAWKQSKQHNAVILNRGTWKKKWNAIGIGIVGSYAVVWFGNEPDK